MNKTVSNDIINDLREDVFNYSYTIDEKDKISHANEFVNYKEEINLLKENKKFFQCAGINWILSEVIRELGIRTYVYHYGIRGLFSHSVCLVELNNKYFIHDAYLNRYLKNDLFSEIKILKNKSDHIPKYIYGKNLNKKQVTKGKYKRFYENINPGFYEIFTDCKSEKYFVTIDNIHDWINFDMIDSSKADDLKTLLTKKFNHYNPECLITLPYGLSSVNGYVEIDSDCTPKLQANKEILESIARL